MSDDGYHARMQIRASYIVGGLNALIAINGGAAVAVIAFLQVVWASAPALVGWMLVALGLFCFGVIGAAVLFFLNHRISLEYEKKDFDSVHGYMLPHIVELERTRERVVSLAFGTFIVAIFVLIVGIVSDLPVGRC